MFYVKYWLLTFCGTHETPRTGNGLVVAFLGTRRGRPRMWRWTMEFRWVVLITLWTVLSGPVFAPIAGSPPRPKKSAVATVQAARVPGHSQDRGQ
jgi:hypothetical protein